MKTIKQTQTRIVKIMIIFDLFAIGISFLALKAPMPFIMGLIFGSAISLLNFIELANTLTRAVAMPPEKAQTFTVVKYFIRYIVTAVVLYVSIVAPYINVLGTILGLIIIKIIILVTNLLGDKNYFRNIFRRKEDESSGQ
ncbi:MAG TPA: ATP synthase subunit I [Clostridiales bacterium UBA8960]|nr:ATP synthase subunit I [Clostridiales bacterium UBA8960]